MIRLPHAVYGGGARLDAWNELSAEFSRIVDRIEAADQE